MRRGLAASREEARASVAAGIVRVSGAPADNSSRMVDPGEPITVVDPAPQYVSRGGAKLAAALDHFSIVVRGRRALDAGASTGGFTDCLLQRGASFVCAVDVGRGQLHERIRTDPRVDVRERVNIRHATANDFAGGRFGLIVADLSFISLATVLPALVGLAQMQADFVLLVKPQFEAKRAEASKGRGVIRLPSVWKAALERVDSALVAEGAAMMDLMVSPLKGADGNVEFLAHARAGEPAPLAELHRRRHPSRDGRLLVAAVAIVPHRGRAETAALAAKAAAFLEENGHEVRIPADDAEAAGLRDWATPDQALCTDLDLAVSLGGDGTMLRAVDLVAAAGVPVLGVNVGHLGYLTEVEPEGLIEALERFFGGDYEIQERMTLAVVTAPVTETPSVSVSALNEAWLEKRLPGRTAHFAVTIAGRPFTTYAADGLIVSTPTGSTAYNLSVRGPIVSPTLRALIMAPVSPHQLFDLSLVLAPDEAVGIEVTDGQSATLLVDGREIAVLDPGDRVRCSAGAHTARLVTFGERDFHQILKAKFGLTDR